MTIGKVRPFDLFKAQHRSPSKRSTHGTPQLDAAEKAARFARLGGVFIGRPESASFNAEERKWRQVLPRPPRRERHRMQPCCAAGGLCVHSSKVVERTPTSPEHLVTSPKKTVRKQAKPGYPRILQYRDHLLPSPSCIADWGTRF